MIKNIFLSLFLSLMIGPHAWANNSDDFQKILTDHWARATKEKVFFRTDPDGFRMNGTLPELSKAARDRRAAFNDKILKRLSHITENKLTKPLPTDVGRFRSMLINVLKYDIIRDQSAC